ncbi:hypothetical protein J3Q64DRAFT_1754923 [Phycomyces blakesleeanus]|uniref:Yeast cell wall synthesis Kre9/Knh1-like N-terminal domain-containing protein n=2 Tax=Phycomyces blakesleeanus TaxID=4837 RepID=A0A162WFR6_PHYB8|nr:hypothetical protein PHYBLDRAFT_79757 [Phycomyces blakesleeanus NRRL 1555(-)]OAD66845.1 hypothetical protein PHYBLDRAFT_79757 [Phycomyces blakesleeanus NRRL 1555(-)]|eukprot:XP_018284885.1 hypothetical protein PHYBLDRAFT_79757 [Phycomyces blakesleeanus NRRL 1555(-)]
MKSVFFSTLAVLAAVVNTASAATFITPWANSTWTAGGHGNITWTASADEAALNCEIQMLNGEVGNANLVAYVTNPASPIACSAGKFDIYPLNDFASGKYSLRIGQSATGNWGYSGVFNFVGGGTIAPLVVVSGTSASGVAASGAAASGAAAASGSAAAAASGVPTHAAAASGKASGSASVSGSSAAASQTVSKDSAGVQITAKNSLFIAAAGAALALAL